MASRQIHIKEDTDFRILRILQQNPEVSQRDLARELGMSLGGLNYCLKALIDKGFVKLSNYQNSKHKLKYVYVLTPSGLAQKVAMTGRFLKRKMQEHAALQQEIQELRQELSTTESCIAGSNPGVSVNQSDLDSNVDNDGVFSPDAGVSR
ncbi:MarR family EPS-associated transcriptional regulator [Orrella marina]|uniref:MarR family EPS-associated transcriptional regulator n=1 Tax=Orrella marina TaxID=2163011 RepID=A0A2R4XGW1_9BURK|nr:MarR family EPS-associated transcriptional regulator [Orrella marina]AWB33050.1 MarR family EPS-associated transcriptional regulator [Orrella marina]